MRTSKTSPQNVPSLEEAERVFSWVLAGHVHGSATNSVERSRATTGLREIVALTIAVVTVTERLHRMLGRPYPEQWESLERSAGTFVDQYVVKWLAENDRALKRAITSHRRRKLSARAGVLSLVETQRSKRARWAAVTLPPEAPLPISEDVQEGLAELAHDAEDRLFDHLAAVPTPSPLILAGQVVGLLAASECLLALLPSNHVAAFCVNLGVRLASSSGT